MMFGNNNEQLDKLSEQLTSISASLKDFHKVLKQLSEQLNRIERRMDRLESEQDKSRGDLNSAEPADRSSKSSGEAAADPSWSLPGHQSSTEFAEKTYYLSAPSPDGSFHHVTAEEQLGKSLYLLSSSDHLSGHFSLLDTPDAIATALISVSQFVKPACKLEGVVGRNPQHALTLEEGTAKCEDGCWRVVKKAIVKFE